jgi:hypothetical protein
MQSNKVSFNLDDKGNTIFRNKPTQPHISQVFIFSNTAVAEIDQSV